MSIRTVKHYAEDGLIILEWRDKANRQKRYYIEPAGKKFGASMRIVPEGLLDHSEEEKR